MHGLPRVICAKGEPYTEPWKQETGSYVRALRLHRARAAPGMVTSGNPLVSPAPYPQPVDSLRMHPGEQCRVELLGFLQEKGSSEEERK